MGDGPRFVALWCAAASAAVLIHPGWGPLLLAPLFHWALLRRTSGRPNLILWLFYMIAVPSLAGSALNYLLVAPVLTEFQAARSVNDVGGMAAANAKAVTWWRYSLLGTVAYTGYAVALSYISIRVGAAFLLTAVLSLAAYELALDLFLDDIVNGDTVADFLKAFWVSLWGGTALWLASKAMRARSG